MERRERRLDAAGGGQQFRGRRAGEFAEGIEQRHDQRSLAGERIVFSLRLLRFGRRAGWGQRIGAVQSCQVGAAAVVRGEPIRGKEILVLMRFFNSSGEHPRKRAGWLQAFTPRLRGRLCVKLIHTVVFALRGPARRRRWPKSAGQNR